MAFAVAFLKTTRMAMGRVGSGHTNSKLAFQTDIQPARTLPAPPRDGSHIINFKITSQPSIKLHTRPNLYHVRVGSSAPYYYKSRVPTQSSQNFQSA